MEKKQTGSRLSEWNALLREEDDIYRAAIRDLGMPDGAFWILYALRADGRDGEELTQSEICQILYQSKQTTNSALKKLEAAGYLELCAGIDRRSKRIHLTEAGWDLAARTADRLIAAEKRAFFQMTGEEQDTLLRLSKKFNCLLRQNTKGLGRDKNHET